METKQTLLVDKSDAPRVLMRLQAVRNYGLLLAFIAVGVGLALTTPRFLTVQNLMIILTQVSINALLAFGVTFVIITGGIDLSIGSMVAVTGVVQPPLRIPTRIRWWYQSSSDS